MNFHSVEMNARMQRQLQMMIGLRDDRRQNEENIWQLTNNFAELKRLMCSGNDRNPLPNNRGPTSKLSHVLTGRNTQATNDSPNNNSRHQQIFIDGDNGGLFYCSCGNSYRQKRSLVSHIRIFTSTCKFSCHLCDKKFANLYPRNEHLAKVHKVVPDPREGKFGCGYCGAIYHAQGELVKHRRNAHSADMSSSHRRRGPAAGPYCHANGIIPFQRYQPRNNANNAAEYTDSDNESVVFLEEVVRTRPLNLNSATNLYNLPPTVSRGAPPSPRYQPAVNPWSIADRVHMRQRRAMIPGRFRHYNQA